MGEEISPHGIPIMQVYGLTVEHDGPFWINVADFDPKLHRPLEEEEPTTEVKPGAAPKGSRKGSAPKGS